jgi:hypothetical protein
MNQQQQATMERAQVSWNDQDRAAKALGQAVNDYVDVLYRYNRSCRGIDARTSGREVRDTFNAMIANTLADAISSAYLTERRERA